MTVQDRVEDCLASDLMPGDVLPTTRDRVARVVSVVRSDHVVDVTLDHDGENVVWVLAHNEILDVIA